jgi:hypothetical protein
MRPAVLALLACFSLAPQPPDSAQPLDPAQPPGAAQPVDLDTLGAQAFRSGYPLTAMAAWRDRYLKAGGSLHHFLHEREMLSAFANERYANVDTLDSSAWVELSSGPVTLNVPATGSRYITIQFISAWTQTFAVLSRKDLDGRPATLLLTPPGWSGAMPSGYRRIACPTSMVAVWLRVFVGGEGDVQSVRSLQRQFVFSGSPEIRPAPSSFLEALGALLPANPPPAKLRPTFERLKPIGLTLDKGFDPTVLDAEARRSIDEAIALSRKDLPQITRQPRRVEGGWVVFDSGPAMPSTLEEMIVRATNGPAAFAALPDMEALYAAGIADSNGQRLYGDRRYVVTLEPNALPPVDGFWSFTVYNSSGMTVFGARHSIHSSTPYLHKTPSGAIRITLGPSMPLAEQYNWLPLQPGEGVHVVLRLYQPRQAALDGSWRLPAIVPAAQAGP